MNESQLAIEASYFGAFQDGVNDQKDRIAELETEIDRLKVELKEMNELSKKECREHALFAHAAGERIGALERQLAEARAEVAEFKATIQPGCCGIATCPGVAEARQDAAREILEWAAGTESYEEWVVMVRERFGLEW